MVGFLILTSDTFKAVEIADRYKAKGYSVSMLRKGKRWRISCGGALHKALTA